MSITLLALVAAAQAPKEATTIPQPSAHLQRAGSRAFRDGGIYHAASGTWTLPGAQGGQGVHVDGPTGPTIPAGSDVVYSNTSSNGTVTVAIGSLSLPGQVSYDGGVLPTPANFTPGLGTPPDRGIYTITGFEISYCDMDPTPMSSGWTFTFYESFDPAVDPASTPVAPASTVELTGMPSGGCYTILIDLTGGMEFTMRGDGAPLGPGWQNELSRDSFGFGIEYTGSATMSDAGYALAGDPEFTGGLNGYGAGTYFADPEVLTSTCGTTGFGNQDGFTLTLGPTVVRSPAQYLNGVDCGMASMPFASAYLELYAVEGPGSSLGSNYCVASTNVTGQIGRMSATGSSIAVTNRLRLEATNLPQDAFGFFLTSRTSGFSVMPGGSQGNLCLDGQIGRFDGAGQVKSSGPEGVLTLDSVAGEWNVLDQPLGASSAPAMAGERWFYTAWYRDIFGGLATSNFANGMYIDFN